MISIKEAIDKICFNSLTLNTIEIGIYDSYSYFLSEDILSDRDYPPFNRAAVDGIAVSSKDLETGKKDFLISQKIFSGDPVESKFKPGSAIHIMTGASVPDGYDVLFKIEDCIVEENYFKYKDNIFKRGMNISSKGENSKEGDIIVKKGTRLDFRSIHSLASVGKVNLKVYQPPRVTIISTGNEVIPPEESPKPYQIRDSNYPGLLFFLKKYNIKEIQHFRVKDDKDEIENAASEGLKSNILIVTGGVSMGEADFVPEILEKLGVKKVFHKVNIKPGKPLWYGTFQGTRVFGFPGNPLSTLVSFKIFLEPLLLNSFGNKANDSLYFNISENRILKGERPEYFPARILFKNGQSLIEPLRFKGSGDITATLDSDGLGFHPLENREISAGSIVEFIPWG